MVKAAHKSIMMNTYSLNIENRGPDCSADPLMYPYPKAAWLINGTILSFLCFEHNKEYPEETSG